MEGLNNRELQEEHEDNQRNERLSYNVDEKVEESKVPESIVDESDTTDARFDASLGVRSVTKAVKKGFPRHRGTW